MPTSCACGLLKGGVSSYDAKVDQCCLVLTQDLGSTCSSTQSVIVVCRGPTTCTKWTNEATEHAHIQQREREEGRERWLVVALRRRPILPNTWSNRFLYCTRGFTFFFMCSQRSHGTCWLDLDIGYSPHLWPSFPSRNEKRYHR